METIEVLIVGAGPSGSALAYLLKKNKINCVLIDKSDFPREKLCGGLITRKAADLFETIYREKFTHFISKSRTINLYNNGKLLVTSCLKNQFYFVDRFKFDHYLLQKYIKIGGKVYTKTKIQ